MMEFEFESIARNVLWLFAIMGCLRLGALGPHDFGLGRGRSLLRRRIWLGAAGALGVVNRRGRAPAPDGLGSRQASTMDLGFLERRRVCDDCADWRGRV